jgi:hypothetical protein
MKERDAERAKQKALELQGEEAKAAEEESQRLYGEAAEIWKKLVEEDQDPFAEARLLRMKALREWGQKRYEVAIALLEQARWKSNQVWDEASDYIIKIKQQGGIPLTLSEKLAVVRQNEAEETLRERAQRKQAGRA